jgi:hypothetical protein
MIYNDADARFDSEGCPAKRRDPCINCGGEWVYHGGWACHGHANNFGKLKTHERFLTQAMHNSISTAQEEGKIQATDLVAGMEFYFESASTPKTRSPLKITWVSNDFSTVKFDIAYSPVHTQCYHWKTFDFMLLVNDGRITPVAIETKVETVAPTSTDLTDWRAWARKRGPNECPCGIATAQCTYHS